MKEIQTLRDYLEYKGLLNASDSQIESAKKEWKRIYQKRYWKRYRKEQIGIVLNHKQAGELKEQADKVNLKVSDYLKYLIKQDKEGVHTKPNLLIEIEVGILQAMDSISRKMKSSEELKSKLLDSYNQLKNLLILLGL